MSERQSPERRPITDSLKCDHKLTYRDIDGETWQVCVRCGFGEVWADGTLIKTTDADESELLTALGWMEQA